MLLGVFVAALSDAKVSGMMRAWLFPRRLLPTARTGARVPTLGVSALASLLRGGSVGQIAVVAAGADVGSGDRHVGRGIGVGDGEGGWCVGGCPRHWEDAINIAERKDEVANAIAELPERLRLIVTLYDYEHLTQHEIAQRLGVSQPRVSQLHSEAISQLRDRLGRDPFRDDDA